MQPLYHQLQLVNFQILFLMIKQFNSKTYFQLSSLLGSLFDFDQVSSYFKVYCLSYIMPPKSKKEQEEQAQRLLEQQKRKEEEQARLALERQRYASQTLKTGLFLPASNQLILNLIDKPSSFISQKLRETLKQQYPSLSQHLELIQLVIKELIFYLIGGQKLFGLKGVNKIEGNQHELLKVRVLAGLAVKIMLNEHKELGGKGKSLEGDERLFKELLALHVQESEGKMKIFNMKELQGIMKCIKNGYFNHFILLQNYKNFDKRQDKVQTQLYLSSPATFYNQKDTNFTDLSQLKDKKQP